MNVAISAKYVGARSDKTGVHDVNQKFVDRELGEMVGAYFSRRWAFPIVGSSSSILISSRREYFQGSFPDVAGAFLSSIYRALLFRVVFLFISPRHYREVPPKIHPSSPDKTSVKKLLYLYICVYRVSWK